MKRQGTIALASLLIMAFVALLPAAACAEGPNEGIEARFAPEEFTYSIGFWIFSEVAEGKVGIKRVSDNDYEAVLSAWTTGAIEKYILMRKDTYTARIKISDDGERFLTKSFEKRTKIEDRPLRRTLTEIDYERGVLVKRSWSGERLRKTEETEIADGVTYYDPITAFYNFRYGALGPVKVGSAYHIKSFPKHGNDVDVDIEVVNSKRLSAYENSELNRADHFVIVKVDKDILESKTGIMELLLNERMEPILAVAKDIILFGDVKGTLVERSVPMEFEKTFRRGGSATAPPTASTAGR